MLSNLSTTSEERSLGYPCVRARCSISSLRDSLDSLDSRCTSTAFSIASCELKKFKDTKNQFDAYLLLLHSRSNFSHSNVEDLGVGKHIVQHFMAEAFNCKWMKWSNQITQNDLPKASWISLSSCISRITSDFKLNDMFSWATLFCAKFLDFNSFYSGIKSKFQSFEFPPVSWLDRKELTCANPTGKNCAFSWH